MAAAWNCAALAVRVRMCGENGWPAAIAVRVGRYLSQMRLTSSVTMHATSAADVWNCLEN